jgi:hypothetical protein
LISLEEDLLSMEMPRSFANHMLEDDDNYKIYVHQSLMRIETVFGRMKYKFAYGNVSQKIVQKMLEEEEKQK